jgi:hypothetical protein
MTDRTKGRWTNRLRDRQTKGYIDDQTGIKQTAVLPDIKTDSLIAR